MKQRIGFLFLFAILFCTLKGMAEENEYTLKYSFNEEEGTASVIGYEGTPVEVIVPEEVEREDGKKYNVASIGINAFLNCYTLSSITLPEDLTSIEQSAFCGCISLTAINLPDGVKSIGPWAFWRCIALPTISLPEGLSYIGESAFSGCESLTDVTLPDCLTSLGNAVFSYCRSLTSIVFPEGLVSIGIGAFQSCSSLNSLVLPKSLMSIGNSAFSECNIDHIDYMSECPLSADYSIFDSSVYSKNDVLRFPEESKSAFNETSPWCWFFDSEREEEIYFSYSGANAEVIGYNRSKELKEVVIPETVTDEKGNSYTVNKIGSSAFNGCRSLGSIVMPKNLTFIGDYAFQYCTALTSLDLPEDLTSIGDFTFYNCSSLHSLSLPEGLSSIGGCAFSGCRSLLSLSLPESLISIGNNAFSYCTLLNSIDLPEDLISIGSRAFEGCNSLTSIKFSKNMTSIGFWSFENCPLEKITYLTDSPISAETNIFSSDIYETATLEIPKGAREAFMATTPWNLFKNIVEEENPEPDPIPGDTHHFLTVNIVNGFTAKMKVIHGEKATVALDLDEWWESADVKFNGEPLEVTTSEIETPALADHSTLEITPRFKGDLEMLDIQTGVWDVNMDGVNVWVEWPLAVFISGLNEGDEVTVYTEAGHIIRTATAAYMDMRIDNLASGTVYIIRINNRAVKVVL